MSVVSSQSKRPRPSSAIDSTVSSDLLPTSSRQRQSRKDEAIRKKIEQELSKKRGGPGRIRHTKKVAGTVSALRPAQALTVRENILVMEAAQLMAAKRSDCVLVVDEGEHLSGIFTAKDLAYRVVATHMDARATTVSDIMTRNPMCVTADTSAQDALNLMVSRGFRHLPVCNDEGDIFGLLDITKCLYEALNKMERAFGSSRKLYDALEGVEKEWANSPVQFVQYMDALREKMSCPDLTTVLDNAAPVQVPVKANVRDVATLMREHHTTAVLVMDHGGLAGIFTSKDIVLRVIAAGLAPENCSVVRVMTPHPDTAVPTTSILDALKKMHDGHYLNLPVIDDDKHIVGLVDVLRLTYATLDQINSIEGNDGDGNKFWTSMMGVDHADNDSVISDSLSQAANSHMFQPPVSPLPDLTLSAHNPYTAQNPFLEVTPGESTSIVNGEDTRSTVSSHSNGTFAFKFNYGSKTHRFRCEFNSFASLREIVRQKIMTEHLSLSQSYVKVSDGAEEEDQQAERDRDDDDSWLHIAYLDDEEDEVLMTSDTDLQDAVELARKQGQDRVRLFVHDEIAEQQKAVAEAAVAQVATEAGAAVTSAASPPVVEEKEERVTGLSAIEVPAGQPTIAAVEQDIEVREIGRRRRSKRRDSASETDDSESQSSVSAKGAMPKSRQRRHRHKRDVAAEFNLPVPQEMLLPAAITFLGVVILGVFAITKLTGSSDRRY